MFHQNLYVFCCYCLQNLFTGLFFLLQLFDGHNGAAAATYSKENLLNNVLSAIPSDLSRNEWIQALPRALVAGFVKTDKDFKKIGMNIDKKIVLSF